MSEATPIETPAGYAPGYAVGYADPTGGIPYSDKKTETDLIVYN